MKVPSVSIPVIRRGKSDEVPGLVATARLDRRTKNLTSGSAPVTSPLSTTLTWTGSPPTR